MKRLPEGITILFARMVICGFVCGALCIFMHELGHGIAAVASGARITEFSILKGYIVTVGGRRGYIARQLFYSAGQIFPALSAVVYALFYRRNENDTYRVFSFLYETVCLFSLFDWVLTPFMWIAGCAPAGDDCTMFLKWWHHSPLIVSAVFLAAAVLLGFIAVRRGIAADFVKTVQNHLDKKA